MSKKMKILSTIEWGGIFFIIFLCADYKGYLPMEILAIFLLSILVFYIWNKKFANFLNRFF